MGNEKSVDEGWKESISKEKEIVDESPSAQVSKDQAASPEGPQQQDAQGGSIDFLSYVTSLAYQSLIFLGEAPSPIDNSTTKNLDQAKLLIDTMVMLRDKTTGNLTEQEKGSLDALLYQLQMKYVETMNQNSTTDISKP